MPPTSEAGKAASAADPRAGYVLLELVAALVLISLLMTMVFPAVPQGTTPVRLRALLASTAILLRDTRTAAIARNTEAHAQFDRRERTIRAGLHRIVLPADVTVSVLAGGRCGVRGDVTDIVFRPDGTNCGSVFRFIAGARAYRIRLNWLTGYVEILEGYQ